MRTDEQILADLTAVMRQAFPDREYSGVVGLQTRLFTDLGLASIDAVVLAEKIEQFYGRRLPFGPLLAGLRARGANDLALGDLVTFLRQQLPGERGACATGVRTTSGRLRPRLASPTYLGEPEA